jgi:hypothetical protein
LQHSAIVNSTISADMTKNSVLYIPIEGDQSPSLNNSQFSWKKGGGKKSKWKVLQNSCKFWPNLKGPDRTPPPPSSSSRLLSNLKHQFSASIISCTHGDTRYTSPITYVVHFFAVNLKVALCRDTNDRLIQRGGGGGGG